MVLASAGTLVSPYILKIIIDEIIPSKDVAYLITILLFLVGINLVRLLLDFYSSYLYSKVSNNIILDIRSELFNKILHFPLSFLDKNTTGDITHRINQEVTMVQGMLTGSIIRFIRNVLTIIGLAVALCLLNLKLFLLSILIVPFILLGTKFFRPKIHSCITESREKDSDILAFFIERFKNIKLIKSFNSYLHENEKLNSKGKDLLNINVKTAILSSGAQNVTGFLVSLSPLIVLAVGGLKVMSEAMTIGALIAFIQYLNRIFTPINDFSYLYWDLIRTSVSMQRIFEFLEMPTEPRDAELKNIDFNKNISFKNVDFKYEDKFVLQNFKLELHKGKKYAIVGNSGCGKSTILNLLLKFYDADKGAIIIGDTDIKQIDTHVLRNHIALISQDNQLFHDSIFENIKYGNTDCSKTDVEKVMKLTGLDSFLNNTDSIIGNEGTLLSGGQKQRIAIARGLLKKADIIILDESTSALDSESEYQIFNSVSNHFTGKTILLISHRFSTIKNVDEIICLDKGKVIEQGTHDNLIALRGVYWKLFRKQIEESSEE
jgi:ABC-type multidrug transport system fused ATPase/permease subunit